MVVSFNSIVAFVVMTVAELASSLHNAGLFLQLQCDWAQIQVIVLTNDGNGFGFGISGSRNSGAVVRNIFPGGAADRVSKEGQWPLFSFASFTQYHFFQYLSRVCTSY